QGQQNVYMAVGDNAGLASQWQQMGTWTPGAVAQPPANVSMTPATGTGITQTFAFKASSAAGYQNVAYVQIIFGQTLTTAGTCFVNYMPGNNLIMLSSDSGGAWIASGTLGTAATIENGQCSLNLAASSSTGSLSTLTVNLAITFKSGLQGQQNVYMAVGDNAGLASQWQQMGTWIKP